MSMETDLVTLLQTVCAKVYPDVAPEGTAPDYLTWQGLGGTPLRFNDGEAPDQRNTLLQINAWSATRLGALALIRAVEDALCLSSAFIARPQAEPQSTHERDVELYGCIQRFSIWSMR